MLRDQVMRLWKEFLMVWIFDFFLINVLITLILN